MKKEGYIAMWRKPVNNTCYASHGAGVQPPICDSDDDPENVCYVGARACVTEVQNCQRMIMDLIIQRGLHAFMIHLTGFRV